jgi:hypothetical protein
LANPLPENSASSKFASLSPEKIALQKSAPFSPENFDSVKSAPFKNLVLRNFARPVKTAPEKSGVLSKLRLVKLTSPILN